MISIVYFIIWAALLQGFFLALVYIFSKKNKSLANTLLGLFLITIVLEAITAILPFGSIGTYNLEDYFSLPDVVLFIPVLFLHFTLEKMGNSHNYKSFLIVHYSLATVVSSITLINLYLFIFNSSSISGTFGFELVYWVHFGVKSFAFIVAVYTFSIAFREIRKYKLLVRNEFSDYDLLQINWLLNLIYALVPAIVLWGIALINVIFDPFYSSAFDIPLFGLIAIFLYYLSYQAYIHPNLFETLPESVLKIKKMDLNTSSSEGRSYDENSDKIENLMIENEYYLEKDLTLYAFAKAINMSPRTVSNCVNQNLGKNFNEWVNGFRVKKAQELLEKDHGNKLTIEGIGMESGFKSRSALYSAFKNKLGRSPGEFRKSDYGS